MQAGLEQQLQQNWRIKRAAPAQRRPAERQRDSERQRADERNQIYHQRWVGGLHLGALDQPGVTCYLIINN